MADSFFGNQIAEYVVRNDMSRNLSVLQESPFTDEGSIIEVQTRLSLWPEIKICHCGVM